MLIRVEMRLYVAGVIADAGGRIGRTAPILAWSRGKTVGERAAWVVKKGGQVRVVRS